MTHEAKGQSVNPFERFHKHVRMDGYSTRPQDLPPVDRLKREDVTWGVYDVNEKGYVLDGRPGEWLPIAEKIVRQARKAAVAAGFAVHPFLNARTSNGAFTSSLASELADHAVPENVIDVLVSMLNQRVRFLDAKGGITRANVDAMSVIVLNGWLNGAGTGAPTGALEQFLHTEPNLDVGETYLRAETLGVDEGADYSPEFWIEPDGSHYENHSTYNVWQSMPDDPTGRHCIVFRTGRREAERVAAALNRLPKPRTPELIDAVFVEMAKFNDNDNDNESESTAVSTPDAAAPQHDPVPLGLDPVDAAHSLEPKPEPEPDRENEQSEQTEQTVDRENDESVDVVGTGIAPGLHHRERRFKIVLAPLSARVAANNVDLHHVIDTEPGQFNAYLHDPAVSVYAAIDLRDRLNDANTRLPFGMPNADRDEIIRVFMREQEEVAAERAHAEQVHANAEASQDDISDDPLRFQLRQNVDRSWVVVDCYNEDEIMSPELNKFRASWLCSHLNTYRESYYSRDERDKVVDAWLKDRGEQPCPRVKPSTIHFIAPPIAGPEDDREGREQPGLLEAFATSVAAEAMARYTTPRESQTTEPSVPQVDIGHAKEGESLPATRPAPSTLDSKGPRFYVTSIECELGTKYYGTSVRAFFVKDKLSRAEDGTDLAVSGHYCNPDLNGDDYDKKHSDAIASAKKRNELWLSKGKPAVEKYVSIRDRMLSALRGSDSTLKCVVEVLKGWRDYDQRQEPSNNAARLLASWKRAQERIVRTEAVVPHFPDATNEMSLEQRVSGYREWIEDKLAAAHNQDSRHNQATAELEAAHRRELMAARDHLSDQAERYAEQIRSAITRIAELDQQVEDLTESRDRWKKRVKTRTRQLRDELAESEELRAVQIEEIHRLRDRLDTLSRIDEATAFEDEENPVADKLAAKRDVWRRAFEAAIEIMKEGL